MKISNQKSRVFRIIMCKSVVLIVFVFLFFGGVKNAHAADNCLCKKDANATTNQSGGTQSSNVDCQVACYKMPGNGWTSQYSFNGSPFAGLDQSAVDKKLSEDPDYAKQSGTPATAETLANSKDAGVDAGSCTGSWNPLRIVFCLLLLAILKFFGFLLSVAAMIFAWAADAPSLTAIINGANIYKSWQTVRDLLNIAFILVLLYTAFAIIFQVDKSNKKIILTVVLMALLVNFSFPITRFIIDVGNSLMYTIFKNLFPDANSNITNIFSNIADKSAIGSIINGTYSAENLSHLLAAIIFTAILAITLLMMSVLFVIRVIALAILIIFSPIGFVGSILPSSVASKIDWWGNLFKYTFFGPVMAFMLYVATKIMTDTISVTQDNSTMAAFGQDVNGGTFIASMARFAIPIIVLWLGMGVAQKMGIEGAGAVTNYGQKALKWLGSGAYKVPYWGFKKTGVPGAAKQKWAQWQRTGITGSERTEAREAWLAEKSPYKVKGAINEQRRKAIQAKREEWKKQGGIPEKELIEMLTGGDKVKAAAAANEIADKHGFKGKNAYSNYEAAKNILKSIGDDSLIKSFDDDVKKKRLDLKITYDIKNPGEDDDGNQKTSERVAKEAMEGLSNADFEKINFKDLFKNDGKGIAKNATKNYFSSKQVDTKRKLEIAKRLNVENQATLETENIFFETAEPKGKSASNPSSGAREINPEDIS